MSYHVQKVDLHRFLASEIPLHELSPDLRQHIRHALNSGADLSELGARAVRELINKQLLVPAGTLRQSTERIALHALRGSRRSYDLRAFLAPEPPVSLQPASQQTDQGDAWASIGAMRSLLRRDWVSYGLDSSLDGLLSELRERLEDESLRLVLWQERIEVDIQTVAGVEVLSEDSKLGGALLDGVKRGAERGVSFRGQQWYAVWAKQRIVGAVASAAATDSALVSECAGAVGDLLQAFLRSQQRVHTDALTGVNNRAFFDHQFTVELERSRRASQPLALLYADIDHFKRVNDEHGHDAGDVVLRYVSRLFITHLRRIDYVFRWGGEEFAILLPGTPREEALHTADRLRKVIEESLMPVKTEQSIHITISIGMAMFPENASTERDLLRCADQALYRAKNGGRNRVILWDGGAPAGSDLPD